MICEPKRVLSLFYYHQSSHYEVPSIVVNSHAYTSTYACRIIMAQWIKTRENLSKKKRYTSHFICKVLCVWEAVGDQTELKCIDPNSYGHQHCVFLVLQCCSTGPPGAQLSAECWLSLPHSFLQLHRSPTQSAPSAGWWLSFPHLVSDFSDIQLTDFLSSTSYIKVQSPTQSLQWHVWSSSSRNNCGAVHRSLSSGASVYECTMGFLPCPIFSAKPTFVISSHNCHRNVSLSSGASF